jgi:hypothetical protein
MQHFAGLDVSVKATSGLDWKPGRCRSGGCLQGAASHQPGELEPVFQTMLANALRTGADLLDYFNQSRIIFIAPGGPKNVCGLAS